MQVEQIDRELFIDILNPDSSTAESVRQGRSYTWEVERLARHRQQARAEVVGEIVAWLREHDVYGEWREGAATIEAKFGGSDGQRNED